QGPSLALYAFRRIHAAHPLRNDSARPPEGALGVVCEIGAPEQQGAKALQQSRNALALLLGFAYTDSSGDSVSESRQEAERRCCGEGRLAWMPNEE
ncbi:hypothetical protein, partial [Pseudomonas yangonensis]|uniref:hypothetical protein n=1 Tax=Pseudomonas yangonensis TaxID=2579922 RepID=UPI001C499B67